MPLLSVVVILYTRCLVILSHNVRPADPEDRSATELASEAAQIIHIRCDVLSLTDLPIMPAGCSPVLVFVFFHSVAAISSEQWGDDMASAERESITGVWGQSPQRGPGAEPLVRGSGGRGEAPLKLKEN